MRLSHRSRRWAEISVLSSFALTQPIYALVGENATFLVAHELSGLALVAYAVALVVAPAIVMVGLDELLLRLSGTAYSTAGAALRGTLLALTLAPPMSRALGWDGLTSVLVLVAMTALGALLFKLVPAASSAVRFAVPAPVVFLVWFLLVSPASALVGSAEDVDVASGSTEDTSVVWLIFDQFPLSLMLEPDGSLAVDRFPNFARLAETSTWYPQATTVASATGIAVPSSLSGRYVPSGTLPVVSATPVNLFTILGGSHAIQATETFTQLCPDSLCRPEPEGTSSSTAQLWPDTLTVLVRVVFADAVADRLVPEMNDRWAGFGQVETADIDLTIEGEMTTAEEAQEHRTRGDDRALAEAFITGLVDSDGPTVHYLHIEKPHEPLILLPDGRAFDHCTCFRVDEEEAWPEEPEMATQRLQQYLLQAIYVDTFVGQVLDAMDASGLSDDAILVVMSDHGVSLLPGTKNRRVDAENVHDILPVPVFVRRPGQSTGAIHSRPIQLVDLLPTVLDELGLTVQDFEMDGLSLNGPNTPGRQPLIITQQGNVAPPADPDPTKSRLPTWLEDLFPDLFDPFRWGPHAELFGQAADELVVGESTLEASIATLDRFSAVEPEGSYVPANVIGQLDGSESPVDLAVAINGFIAGTGTTFLGTSWHISLMVDPADLVEGANDLALYEITSEGLLEVSIR